MVRRPDVPKIFLFSAGGRGARERMERSVGRGFAEVLSQGFELDFEAAGVSPPEGRLRAWGAHSSQRNRTNLRALAPGDLGIGYVEGRFAYVARLADDLHSPGLAAQLWGDRGPAARELIYLFDEVEPIELDRQQVLEALGYSPLFVPRGLVVPAPDHQPDEAPEMSTANDLADWLVDAAAGMPARPEKTKVEAAEPQKGHRRALPGRADEMPPPISAAATAARMAHATSTTPEEPEPLPDAYARIEAPPVVIAGEEFPLVVGLADSPQLDVGGGRIPRPEGLSEYKLTVQLVAPAFDMRKGESPRVELSVTPEDPFPTAEMHLTARETDADAALLKVLYSVEAETVGLALRAVAIVADETLRGTAVEPPQDPSFPFTVPPGKDVPDITVRILKGPNPGTLLWSMETPCKGLDTPAEAETIGIGIEPQKFVLNIVEGISRHKDKPDIGAYIDGKASIVGEKVPPAFWSLLRDCAERRKAGGTEDGADGKREASRPRVLILTEDPYVPWELGEMSEPLIDDADKPCLGAQAIVGRWIFGPHSKPPPPEADSRRLRQPAVVSGTYRPELEEAAEEAKHLVEQFNAREVAAELEPLIAFLRGGETCDLMHFATHGNYEPGEDEHGLVLTDGTLEPDVVRGTKLAAQPFVFLNACQVGAGEEELGVYAGMPGAFVHAGACGVVAPVWSIADRLARLIATGFYDRAQDGGVSPAEYFREQRATRRSDKDARTYVAYQFYGHPSMRVAA
jgi:hypothetical protein